jgi:hypothetical protein
MESNMNEAFKEFKSEPGCQKGELSVIGSHAPTGTYEFQHFSDKEYMAVIFNDIRNENQSNALPSLKVVY